MDSPRASGWVLNYTLHIQRMGEGNNLACVCLSVHTNWGEAGTPIQDQDGGIPQPGQNWEWYPGLPLSRTEWGYLLLGLDGVPPIQVRTGGYPQPEQHSIPPCPGLNGASPFRTGWGYCPLSRSGPRSGQGGTPNQNNIACTCSEQYASCIHAGLSF